MAENDSEMDKPNVLVLGGKIVSKCHFQFGVMLH